MPSSWFYAHDDKKVGPFSGEHLKTLADAGHILRTDTVWKQGIDKGVLATRVRYLFPTAPAVELLLASAPLLVAELLPPCGELIPLESPPEAKAEAPVVTPAAATPAASYSQPAPARKKRAVARKGAVIITQDGTHVKFKKKCTTCGFEESSWNTMTITSGTMKAAFFCPKCRKRCEVEMQGQQC